MANPFEQNNDGSNPFTESSKTIAEYNPFQNQAPTKTGPPSYNAYTSPKGDPNEVQALKAQLAEKDKQLQDLQSQLQYKNRMIQETAVQLRVPNWPKWPKPILYHDIESDITDSKAKRMVKKGYFCWFMTVFCTTWNMICLFMAIFVPAVANNYSIASEFGAALFFWAFWVPLSFILWYRPLYNAARKDRSALYVFFLITFAVHIGVAILYSLGFYTTGSAGVINSIQLFSNGNIGVGICFLISAIGWILLVLFSIYIIKEVYSQYRSQGHTLDKAKNEITTEAGKVLVEASAANAANVASTAFNTNSAQN